MVTAKSSGLYVENLSISYGGVRANNDVTLSVSPGEIVGLIGPNGAGKTSFVDGVSGFARTTGSIHLSGRPVETLGAHTRRRLGLSRTWQAGELFPDLTVRQNVAIAETRRRWFDRRSSSNPQRGTHTSVEEALDLLGLTDWVDATPDELPLGPKKMTGVARALVGTVDVLLLDEPAAGLGTHEGHEFAAIVRSIAARDKAVLLIDHDIDLVRRTCDRGVVLEFGSVIAAGPIDDVLTDPQVIRAYLGGSAVERKVVTSHEH